MRQRSFDARRSSQAAGLACLALLAWPLSRAQAAEPQGFYAGATLGKGELDISTPAVSHFGSDNTAFKLIVGMRPISAFGVELAYVDFGRPSRRSRAPFSDVTLATDASMRGVAGFGVLYLPTSLLDFYLKAGLASLRTTADTRVVGCASGGVCPPAAAPPGEASTDVGLAGGFGAQYRIASFDIRAEYERFNAAGGDPYLVSLGATWNF